MLPYFRIKRIGDAMTIRYATIGTGWITESFIKGTELSDGKLKLEAVYSRSAEKGSEFAKKFGCDKVYVSLDELAADKTIDAVYIASPNAFHYSQSKAMLIAGKHVICEKPITVTSAELIELNKLAESKGLVYLEALMAMHLPYRNAIKEAILSLGRISHARFDFSQRSSKYDSFKNGNHQNIFDPKIAAGALMDLGVYCVYPCIDLFGEPKEISSWCTRLRTGIDGEGGATFRYDGLSVTLTYSKTGQSALGSEIIGDNGTLVIPSISKLCDARVIYTDKTEKTITDSLEKHELMSCEALDFYRYITEPDRLKAQYENDRHIALSVCRTMETIRKQIGLGFNAKEDKNE